MRQGRSIMKQGSRENKRVSCWYQRHLAGFVRYPSMLLHFLSTAGCSAGASFLVEVGQTRFLVDCARTRDALRTSGHESGAFGFDARSIDFVLLTQAHPEHTDLLPELRQAGFAGPVYATPAIHQLLSLLRPRLKPVRMLDNGHATTLSRNVQCRYRWAGHLPGSAIVEIWLNDGARRNKLVISGALGQPGSIPAQCPARIDAADVLVMSATCADRHHSPPAELAGELRDILQETLVQRRGNVILPALPFGQVQRLLYSLLCLTRLGNLRQPKVFIDSPTAAQEAPIMQAYLAACDTQARPRASTAAAETGLPYLYFVQSKDDSRALDLLRSGAIIIAGDDLGQAGRVRHHLLHHLPRRECSVVFTRRLVAGSLAQRLVDGARKVRLYGRHVPVRASIHLLEGLSGHADLAGLLAWTHGFKVAPRQTFVVQGETLAAATLAERLKANRGWHARVPAQGETVSLLNHDGEML